MKRPSKLKRLKARATRLAASWQTSTYDLAHRGMSSNHNAAWRSNAADVRAREICAWLAGYEAAERDQLPNRRALKIARQWLADSQAAHREEQRKRIKLELSRPSTRRQRAIAERAKRRAFFKHQQPCGCVMCK